MEATLQGLPDLTDPDFYLGDPSAAPLPTPGFDDTGAAAMRAGDKVRLHFAAANRDESVFGTDADNFRIDRDPNPHVAMSVGEHYCLGAHLGKLESRLFFEEFLNRFSFVLAGSAPRVRTTHIRGLRSVPLVVWAA
jgi:cytochrome P450